METQIAKTPEIVARVPENRQNLIFDQAPMPFGAVSVRVVEKFLIVFRNDSPMLDAVNAGARRTKKRGPKPFKSK